MIAVSSGAKKYPFRIIASTDAGEIAYYVEPSFMKSFGLKPPSDDVYENNREAKSVSGREWFPNILTNGRLTMFIAGNPGAGKSFLAKEMISLLPKDCDILLFTALEEDDGNFTEFGPRLHKIRMVPETLRKITLSEIRKRGKRPVLLFDDVDKIRNKEVEKLTFAILEDALANGRGHEKHDGVGDIHVIATSHALNDYRKTKYTLENSDYVGVFPQSTTYAQMQRLFEKIGLDKTLCDEVMRLGRRGEVRAVIVRKVAPMYIICGDVISLL